MNSGNSTIVARMSTSFNFYIGLLSLSAVLGISFCYEFPPPPLTKCHFNDESCYIEQVHKFLTLSKTGVPEIGLEPFEPLFLDTVEIVSKNDGPTKMDLKISDLYVYNWTKATVTSMKGFQKDDKKPMKLTVTVNIPTLTYKGKYAINGKVLILPIVGEGDAQIDASGITVKLSITFKSEKHDDGKTYMQVDKYSFAAQAKDAKIQMSNLFNGDKELSDNVLKVMNDNWILFKSDFDPPINKAYSEAVSTMINKIVKDVAYEDFFLE